ncbi:MAG: hypothetical protein NVV62_16685 [Terricaulis sp.]|nr:hypothetical protein [Terricaulis sp.]
MTPIFKEAEILRSTDQLFLALPSLSCITPAARHGGARCVLVIGSGGREHASAWKIAQSPKLTKLFVMPGNGGTEAIAENLSVDIDHAAVIAAAKAQNIDFVVVGPDAQVVAGLGDDVRAAGFTCFCPSKAAGQLLHGRARRASPSPLRRV